MVAEAPIYLDYQASTPVDPRVVCAVASAMESGFGNPHSEAHVEGWRARELVEAARGVIGRAIGAAEHEVLFTSGATEADNIGVLGAALGAPEGRRRILVGAFEHKAVLEAARAAERFGFSVETVRITPRGIIDLHDLSGRLGPDVAVVSVMAVNNEIGTIQPVDEVATISAAAGAFVHTDATQAPSAMDVDVSAWGVDAASFSSHKIYGPKGVGALFLSDLAPWRPSPLMFGGGQEQGLRPGTLPTPLCIGLAEAFEILAKEGRRERARVAELRDEFAARLSAKAPHVMVTSPGAPKHPGNLHLRFPGVEAEDLLAKLQPRVCASSGSACTSGVIEPSHVLAALGWDHEASREGIRFSIGRFTTEAELREASTLILSAADTIMRRAA